MKNKLGKAVAIVALAIALCLTLSACDPAYYCFTSEYLSDVTSIELINYDNPEQKEFMSWVPDHTSDLKSFDSSKMSCLETLDESKKTEFIDTLCEEEILGTYFAFDSPNGICIKLNYSNGDFLIIWSNYQENAHSGYIGKYSPDGEVSDFIGCFENLNSYLKLVNKYFQSTNIGIYSPLTNTDIKNLSNV